MKKLTITLSLGTILSAMTMVPHAAAQDTSTENLPRTTDEPGGALRLRDRVVPLPEDAELLQEANSLMLAGKKDAATIIYELRGGKIRYRVIGGTISETKRAQIDAAVAVMQQRIDK
ncbi:MAG: hypothetical protein ABJP02_11155 [Parasphingorhabdus sp.]|uniref:hypothetical protein n=1 Tax=Parasphingorhabdus sp. TaxID=2709688 RepID=UPI00329988A1